MLHTILFDLDGTLLPMDQEKFVKSYLHHLTAYLAPLGYDAKTVAKAIWAGMDAMIGNDGARSNEQVFWECFSKFFARDVLADQPVFAEFYRTDFQKVAADCGYHPAARQLIDSLNAAGFRLILATNPVFPAVATESRMRWAGLEPENFAYYTTYENSRYCKPNPDYYRDILHTLAIDPAECMMVGNDVDEDMVAAQLRMQVFLLTDCLINRKNEEISRYPHGSFPELRNRIAQCAAG